jgi:hypothetical protein
VLPTWKQALDAPGATQLGLLKKIFTDRDEWWQLVPDQGIFASGGNTEGRVLNLAARHKNGRWAMAYLAKKSSCSINMSKITSGERVEAVWIDPRDGREQSIGSFSNSGTHSFSTPDGWEDALLILESAGG